MIHILSYIVIYHSYSSFHFSYRPSGHEDLRAARCQALGRLSARGVPHHLPRGRAVLSADPQDAVGANRWHRELSARGLDTHMNVARLFELSPRLFVGFP